MAKLADALDLGSSVRKDVWVQVPPSAPNKKTSYSWSFLFNSSPVKKLFSDVSIIG